MLYVYLLTRGFAWKSSAKSGNLAAFAFLFRSLPRLQPRRIFFAPKVIRPINRIVSAMIERFGIGAELNHFLHAALATHA